MGSSTTSRCTVSIRGCRRSCASRWSAASPRRPCPARWSTCRTTRCPAGPRRFRCSTCCIATPESHRRAEHGQPQEQQRSELGGPAQRGIEHIPRNNTREKKDDFRDDQQRDRDFYKVPKEGVRRAETTVHE